MHEQELKDYSIDISGVQFMGVLHGMDLSVFDNQKIELLIQKNIYVLAAFQYHEGDEFAYYSKPPKEFELDLDYKERRYTMNPVIIAEIFCQLEVCAIGNGVGAEIEIEKIFFKLKSLVGKKDKIKYLKKRYQKNFPKDSDYEWYSDLENEGGEVLGVYVAWYEYVYFYLCSESGYFFVKLYLTYNKTDLYYNFSDLITLTLNWEESEGRTDLRDLLDKWHDFHEKDLILSDIQRKIEEIEKGEKSNEDNREKYLELSYKYDLTNECLSASEIAYYVYYKDYAKERVIEDDGLKREEYWKKIGETFGKNGANIRKEHGKLVRDKEYRLQPTFNRVSMLEKILPLLSEKSKIHCKDELEIIKLNL
ncbi:hypothetical protein [Mangrovimonas xylaniphaga]|uniref:hypothetical protein n=1 Tax=Mangrovimonas xylaniphaga TaxID=1645915 RepID=UPI000A65D75B|nr:hypothetical protein [Mangrovimonas xylaniphaga]